MRGPPESLRRPITPAELKERALNYGDQAWRVARREARAAFDRTQARFHTAVRKPLPYGLPPLIEVEQYRTLARQPAALAVGVGLLCVAACCCICCCCRLYNRRRQKQYRLYTPITGDLFDEGEQEISLLTEIREEAAGHDPEAGGARTVRF